MKNAIIGTAIVVFLTLCLAVVTLIAGIVISRADAADQRAKLVALEKEQKGVSDILKAIEASKCKCTTGGRGAIGAIGDTP